MCVNSQSKENPMSTEDFIIELFCQVDDLMFDAEKHLKPSCIPAKWSRLPCCSRSRAVVIGVLPLVEPRLTHLFPHLPDRTVCFLRLFNSHRQLIKTIYGCTQLALGVIDSHGIGF